MELVDFFVTNLDSFIKLKTGMERSFTMVSYDLFKQEANLPLCKRLIVLVPSADFDPVAIGRRIWSLALAHHCTVLFLAVVSNLDEELWELQKMARLAAVTRDVWVNVETEVMHGPGWKKAIQMLWRPGDLILCLDNHMIRTRLLWRKPLSVFLGACLDVPVYILPHELDQHAGRSSSQGTGAGSAQLDPLSESAKHFISGR